MNLRLSDKQIVEAYKSVGKDADLSWIDESDRAIANRASKHTAREIVEWMVLQEGEHGNPYLRLMLIEKLKTQGLWRVL